MSAPSPPITTVLTQNDVVHLQANRLLDNCLFNDKPVSHDVTGVEAVKH
jgi:hypothetical protein